MILMSDTVQETDISWDRKSASRMECIKINEAKMMALSMFFLILPQWHCEVALYDDESCRC
jgi:hypothetical protein